MISPSPRHRLHPIGLGLWGLGLGVLVGMLAQGWEGLILSWTGRSPLHPREVVQLLPVYMLVAGLPALCAAIAGLGIRTALLVSLGVYATLCGGPLLAGPLAAQGIQSSLLIGMLTTGLMATAIVSLIHRSSRDESPWREGLALAGWLAVSSLLSLHLNPGLQPLHLRGVVAILFLAVGVAWAGGLLAMVLPRGMLLGLAGLMAWSLRFVVEAGEVAPLPVAAPGRGPGLVLVVVDGLRADHLGAYGYGHRTSPNLDALAARGLLYRHAISPAPWCLPATASLLTGMYPSQHGLGRSPDDQAPLSEDLPTLAQRLAQAGYQTVALVTSADFPVPTGMRRGFRTFDATSGLRQMPGVLPVLELLRADVSQVRLYTPAGTARLRALDLLQAVRGGPFFLFLHFSDLEGPYPAPSRIQEEFPPDLWPSPAEANYDANIRYVDEVLGALLSELPVGTWLAVTADHGTDWGDHPGYPDEGIPPGVRSGHTLYNELVEVPLLISGPGIQPARVERRVRSMDLVPTFLRLAGLDPPSDMDARLLSEVVVDPIPPGDAPIRSEAVLYGSKKTAFFTGDWKIIRTRAGDELYDLPVDPRERLDRAPEGGLVLQDLGEVLPDDAPLTPPEDLDERFMHLLRGLAMDEPEPR